MPLKIASKFLQQHDLNSSQNCAYRSSPCRAFSMASGSWERSKSWVMTGEPRHNVDRRLITVDMLGLDLGSVGATTTGPEHNKRHPTDTSKVVCSC